MAVAAMGFVPIDCGALPTPALALHAMATGSAAIMVTGSHIPADRNGLKFYLPTGEITKEDEAGILLSLEEGVIADSDPAVADEGTAAIERYCARYRTLLADRQLRGWRIGVYEHSSVARDVLAEIVASFGAEIVRLGRTESFVAVDTEAFSDPVFAPLHGWIEQHNLDAIISADGDGDRPLMMTRQGDFVRGDILGLLAAQFLGADRVVTPVTSSSGIERIGVFDEVLRTKVGSPYVIEAMAGASGAVVGFEANGGTLVGRNVTVNGDVLPELATRDAVLPLLAALGLASGKGRALDRLVEALSLPHARSGRLQDVPTENATRFMRRLANEIDYADTILPFGITRLSQVDGLQFHMRSGDVIHFRMSGNAPEMRCYVEAGSPERADELLRQSLRMAAREIDAA